MLAPERRDHGTDRRRSTQTRRTTGSSGRMRDGEGRRVQDARAARDRILDHAGQHFRAAEVHQIVHPAVDQQQAVFR